jgi:hypothetical protein
MRQSWFPICITPSQQRMAARCRCTTGSRMDWWFGFDCRPVQASVQALKIEHDDGTLEIH